MAFALPTLPYAKDALAPHLSAETLDYHYGKHHAAYVNKLNELTAGTSFAELSPEELIRRIDEVPAEKRKVTFNQVAQHFNHTFYWYCLAPNAGGAPSGALADAIVKSFGSFEAFQERFTAEALGHFGSGWAWLVQQADGSLAITSTHDADSPLAHGQKPLLTCDVWEHAYYVDYRNLRAAYVKNFWSLVNWSFVADQLAA